MDWDDLRFLLATVRAGSFSSAARKLGVATTTVTRRIQSLEESAGVRLFDRTPDGPVITPDGERIARLAMAVEERVADLERSLAAQCEEQPLRISAMDAAAEIIAENLDQLYAAHPNVRLELCSESNLVSLARRQADIAVRLFRPDGQSLVVRKLADIELGLFAHRDYIAMRPEVLEDLQAADLLGYDLRLGPLPELSWFTERGLDACFRLRTNDTRVLNRAALKGLGVALMSVSRALAHPELMQIPTRDPLPARSAWAVFHEDLRDRPGLRTVVDFLVEVFGRSFAAPARPLPAPPAAEGPRPDLT